MGCSSSTEVNPDRDLFFAVCNHNHAVVKSLTEQGANINWEYKTSSKKDIKRNMSTLGLAFYKNYRDFDILLRNQHIDYSNEGTVIGIFNVYIHKRVRVLLEAFKLGFGFHHDRFARSMEYGNDAPMLRFKEACLCPFASRIYENPSMKVDTESKVWAIIYRALGIPTDMFTVMFALGRLPGWIAQWKEMTEKGEPIGRPRQVYTGATERGYVAMSNR